ncbi:hypothetical protein OG361_06180 [Streptomyces sp. NBC_00090]
MPRRAGRRPAGRLRDARRAEQAGDRLDGKAFEDAQGESGPGRGVTSDL